MKKLEWAIHKFWRKWHICKRMLARAVEGEERISPTPPVFRQYLIRLMRNLLWLPVKNWIGHLIVQAIRKSVHNCSSNSGVKWTSCRRSDAATRQPAPTATRRLNCRLCRDGTERFRLYIALPTADYVRFASNFVRRLRNVQAILWWKNFENRLVNNWNMNV